MTRIPVTEPLNKNHNRDGFSCGEQILDVYLKQYAGQEQKRRVAAVFVLPGDDKVIKGYYTLSSTHILSDTLPQKLLNRLPKQPYQPATLLDRLAVDTNYQKQGIGESLFLEALFRSHTLSEQVGSIAVVVDALNASAVSFYESFGFKRLSEQNRLFLPMKTIGQLF